MAARKKEAGDGPAFVVGFAAETEDLLENARVKLKSKDLDLIAANDVSGSETGIGVDQNRVTLIWKDGKSKELGTLPKAEVGNALIEEAARLFD